MSQLNLIYGLFLTILVLIISLISDIVDMFTKRGKDVKLGAHAQQNTAFTKAQQNTAFTKAQQNTTTITSALSMMDDILGGDPVGMIEPVTQSEFVIGGATNANTKVDFPIADATLKQQFEEGFNRIYDAPPRAPDEIFAHIDGELSYNEEVLYTPAYHIGQRKLILNEIQFLSKIGQNAVVVYAGSAPSNKGAFLAHLFPRMRFCFIDPNKFEIRPYGNIEVKHLDASNDTSAKDLVDSLLAAIKHANICTARVYMTAAIAEEFGQRNLATIGIPGWKETPGLYFISDIRTNIDDIPPTTFDIMWNSAQHVNWITKMKPVRSMLKFRCPFFNEDAYTLAKYDVKSHESPFAEDFDAAAAAGIDLRTFTEKTFQYFDGEIFIQPWAPISSTESRLVVASQPQIRKYDYHEYENKFFYYNKLLRAYQYYINPNANKALGFDHCADCALENLIWTEYCLSCGINPDAMKSEIHHYVKTLSELTFRQLNYGHHGRHFGKLPLDVIVRRHAEYKVKK
jgi:Poly A polymerase regulatory subunit